MSELTLILIVFFTLYDGISSKFTQTDIVNLGRWIDYKSIKFIRKFRDYSNTELFDKIHNKSIIITLAFWGFLFVSALIKINPIYGSIGFVIGLILMISFTNPKRYLKDFKRSFNNFFFMVLMTIGAFAIMWIHDIFTGKHLLKNFLQLTYQPISEIIQQLGITNIVFWSILIATLTIGAFFNFIIWLTLHGLMRVTFSLSRFYVKKCLWLNKSQPLKPFYLISKTLILIASYFLA